MPFIRKNTMNRSLIYGDFDRDGVPNIDDKYPFNKRRRSQQDELRLSNEMRTIRKKALAHRAALNFMMAHFKQRGYKVKGRIKTITSIINKFRRKHLNRITDLGAMVLFVGNDEEAREVTNYLISNFKVINVEDFYQEGHRTGVYKAIHVIVEKNGQNIEIQIKKHSDYERALKTHKGYKLGRYD